MKLTLFSSVEFKNKKFEKCRLCADQVNLQSVSRAAGLTRISAKHEYDFVKN